MTTAQKLQIRASEIRQRLNEISGLADLTAEQRQESDRLTGEFRDTETKLRAAIIAEGDEAERRAAGLDTEDAEQRERRELRGRAQLHRFVSAAIERRGVDGAEAEYAAAENCGGLVPLSLFGGTAEERAAEWRARQDGGAEHRAVTPGVTSANAQTNQARVIPALFDRSVAGWLGIEMPTAAVGVASYPVLATSLTAGMKAVSTDAPESAGSFVVRDADPRRLTGSLRIRREDAAKLADLEVSLRANLSTVVSDEFDKQLVNGDNVSPNLQGLFQQLTDPDAPAAGAETFGRFATAFASCIDGLFATMPGDVRALVGAEALRHMAATFATNDDSTSAYMHLMTQFGGVRASRRIAAPPSIGDGANIQQAIIRRTNPAGDRVAVAPIWGGIELIRDPYTGAGKGEIVVTAIALVGGVVILRDGAFEQAAFRLAA